MIPAMSLQLLPACTSNNSIRVKTVRDIYVYSAFGFGFFTVATIAIFPSVCVYHVRLYAVCSVMRYTISSNTLTLAVSLILFQD